MRIARDLEEAILAPRESTLRKVAEAIFIGLLVIAYLAFLALLVISGMLPGDFVPHK